MAESTLTLGYPEFCAEVGYYLGLGYDNIAAATKWSADNIVAIDAIVQAGLRQFYNPPGIAGAPPHTWSFLWPITTLATVASDYDYTLPDDFDALAGELTYAPADSTWPALKVMDEGQIRALQQGSVGLTGRPRVAALQWLLGTGATGQRAQLLLWPTPDGIYTLSYRYRALQNKLTSALPYPRGGMAHSETILASCLAVAELRENDARGGRWAKFMERLQADVATDRARGPEYLGYCGDPSVERTSWFGRRDPRLYVPTCTYMGVQY